MQTLVQVTRKLQFTRRNGPNTPISHTNQMFSVNISNVLNHYNPGGYQGVLSSNQFGQATSVNTGFGGGPGGGGGTTANNRRIDFSLRVSF